MVRARRSHASVRDHLLLSRRVVASGRATKERPLESCCARRSKPHQSQQSPAPTPGSVRGRRRQRCRRRRVQRQRRGQRHPDERGGGHGHQRRRQHRRRQPDAHRYQRKLADCAAAHRVGRHRVRDSGLRRADAGAAGRPAVPGGADRRHRRVRHADRAGAVPLRIHPASEERRRDRPRSPRPRPRSRRSPRPTPTTCASSSAPTRRAATIQQLTGPGFDVMPSALVQGTWTTSALRDPGDRLGEPSCTRRA